MFWAWFSKEKFQKENSILVPNLNIHVTGFDFKPTIAIMYFWSTNRQDGDVSEFFDDIRITLPTLWPSNALYTFATQISRNRQILASSASRINRERLWLNKTHNRLGRSCWIKPGWTNAWWEKFLNNEVADTEWVENFRMSRSSFFDLVTILRPYLQKQQTKIQNPIAVECQVAIFLYYISDEWRY